MSIFSNKMHIIAGLTLMTASAYSMACTGNSTDCDGTTTTSATATTNITVNLNGTGLSDLSRLTGVVVPSSQVNSGNVNATTQVYAPIADFLTSTSTGIGNLVNLNLDQKATVVANQFNSGQISSSSTVTKLGNNDFVKEKLEVTATAVGNLFNSALNNTASGANSSIVAAINQCNTGNIIANATYNYVDPKTLLVTSTAVGNLANIASTGVSLTIR